MAFQHGSLVVGAQPVVLPIVPNVGEGVTVEADDDNSGVVYYGASSQVLPTPGNSRCGYPVRAGRERFIPADYFKSPNQIWLTAGAEGQIVYFRGQ